MIVCCGGARQAEDFPGQARLRASSTPRNGEMSPDGVVPGFLRKNVAVNSASPSFVSSRCV